MGEQEKQGAIEAWRKHMERSGKTRKFASFSSIAEAEFCENFKRGLLTQVRLTREEKMEILNLMKP